ncbi:hypothetical protein OPT61_g2418 [Boeremia exigua]|uniref:Uncharacterized protein n=1 Tax=Boeremia exigua TaxID=749465 RepID=A0ACC2ILK5_9PLEO|nr:hypothetical protein OPT61_g2418 [Boeremia exigua]
MKDKAGGRKHMTNGVGINGVGSRTSMYGGQNLDAGDRMDIDEESTSRGRSVKDIDELDVALDAVLEVGEL